MAPYVVYESIRNALRRLRKRFMKALEALYGRV